jgi:pimeloyl-ACP methyl ester carboxylesterase
VGHSYGGVVITEGGQDPKVSALVYIAAFTPDKGESVNTLIADPPPGAPVPPILPPKDGYVLLDRERFHASFAGDLPQGQGQFMAKVPWGLEALNGAVSEPAWRAQRAMAERAGAVVTESPGSHSVYVSQPDAVVDLIKQATLFSA